ncbi:forkhead box protein F2-like [Watersipora subatra]|uniref:forkhead box protein F2-like n=1 Tax=Watersipora subatra TaxID=2589382 RepID=UPI00355C4C22
MLNTSNGGFQILQNSPFDVHRVSGMESGALADIRQRYNALLPPIMVPYSFALPSPVSAASLLSCVPTNMRGSFPLVHELSPQSAQSDPKPNHSYIGLIAMAILSSPKRQLILNDIYQWIMAKYIYFRTRGSGWKNSIRHNLSLNDCFIKSGRSLNGKGHFWTIHPANIEDFQKGDFRRRRAQQRVKRYSQRYNLSKDEYIQSCSSEDELPSPGSTSSVCHGSHEYAPVVQKGVNVITSQKRCPKPFDIESLLGIKQADSQTHD